MNELTANGLIALWVVPLLQWAKKSDIPWLAWINQNSAGWISAAIALLTALGLHLHHDPVTGDFGITGNTGALLHAFTQFTLQHTGHKGYVALQTVTDICKKFDQFAAWQVQQTKTQNAALGVETKP